MQSEIELIAVNFKGNFETHRFYFPITGLPFELSEIKKGFFSELFLMEITYNLSDRLQFFWIILGLWCIQSWLYPYKFWWIGHGADKLSAYCRVRTLLMKLFGHGDYDSDFWPFGSSYILAFFIIDCCKTHCFKTRSLLFSPKPLT